MTGKISPEEIGKTLHHEHLLVDFVAADSINYDRWDKNEVVEKVLPYLFEIKNAGYSTLVDATPAFLGRDPLLLKMLSEQSGVQILTNTGLYGAYKIHLPKYFYEETAEELSQRWINEYKNSIEGTGVFPGFIKIAVDRAPLEDIHRKLVKAACLTHLQTGLTIMSHTGLAVPAFQQLEILKENGVHPSAFIWTHANNEKDYTKQIEAAKMGTWIAFDKFMPESKDEYIAFAKLMKKSGLLNKLLFSHDSGWFDPAKPGGGEIRGYMDIENFLIPALKENGFSQEDIDLLFIKNPAEAFTVKIRSI
ncbi:MAG: phosphotriesterase [Prolixibacteraceae bacterium]|nr:phosphotriesterase [Prolixibacteraceae bacterium]